jgi:hypothetical protein
MRLEPWLGDSKWKNKPLHHAAACDIIENSKLIE